MGSNNDRNKELKGLWMFIANALHDEELNSKRVTVRTCFCMTKILCLIRGRAPQIIAQNMA